MIEKKVGNETFYLEKGSSSLQWLAALIQEKHAQAVQSLIRDTDEKKSNENRGRIILANELLKSINEL